MNTSALYPIASGGSVSAAYISLPHFAQAPLQYFLGTEVQGVGRRGVVAGTGVHTRTLQGTTFLKAGGVELELAAPAVTTTDDTVTGADPFALNVTSRFLPAHAGHIYAGVALGAAGLGGVAISRPAAKTVALTAITPVVGATDPVQVLHLQVVQVPAAWGTAARTVPARVAFLRQAVGQDTVPHLLAVTLEDGDVFLRRYTISPTGALRRVHTQEADAIDTPAANTPTDHRLQLAAAAGYIPVDTGVSLLNRVSLLSVLVSAPDLATGVTPPTLHAVDAVNGLQNSTAGTTLPQPAGVFASAGVILALGQSSTRALIFGNVNAAPFVRPVVWAINAQTLIMDSTVYLGGVNVFLDVLLQDVLLVAAHREAVNGPARDKGVLVGVPLANLPQFPAAWSFDTAAVASVAPVALFDPLSGGDADVRAVFVSEGSLVGDISFASRALQLTNASVNQVRVPRGIPDLTRTLLRVSFNANTRRAAACACNNVPALRFLAGRISEFTSADASASNVILTNGVVQFGGSAGIAEPVAGMQRWSNALSQMQVYDGTLWREVSLV